MKIYFIHHGETIWNKKGILQGHKDSSLTPKGKRFAKRVGRALEKENIEIIYSSDLGRCVQTAKIINQRLSVKLIKNQKLRERNFGNLNGHFNKEVSGKLDLYDAKEKASKGESINDLKKRVITIIRSLSKNKFEKILLVIHEGVMRIILAEYYKTDYFSSKCNILPDAIYVLKIAGNKIKKRSLKLIKL